MTLEHAYFVRGDDGVEYGPVEMTELREWVAENRVGIGTSVRPDATDSRWSAWQHYPELVALLAEVRVTGNGTPLPVLAPLMRRIAAAIVDLCLSFALAIPPAMLLYLLLPPEIFARAMAFSQAVLNGLTPPNPYPAWFLIAFYATTFTLPLLYYAGFVAVHGYTPGKSIMRLQVVDSHGRKPSPGKAFVRAFIYMVCVYSIYGIPLLFFAFFNPQRRAVHDIVAGTYVVES